MTISTARAPAPRSSRPETELETRANHLLIGSFVIASLLGLLGVVAWLTRLDVDQQRTLYDIYFEDSVAGLGVGGDVRYRGIRIGRVKQIDIAPQDPRKVRVTIEQNSGPVIRQGDRAELMLQGITGIAFINVQGAGPNDPPLRDEESDARPVIPATPSQFSQLFASAPDLLVKGIQLAEQLNQVFGPENQALLRGTLQDLRAFSATLSEQRERLASLLAELERDGQAMRAAANNFNTAAESADQFFSDGRETLQSAKATLDSADQALSGELKNLLREASTAAAGFAGAANELQAMLADTREPLRDFSEEGLVEFTEAAREAKRFTRDLSRLVDRLDQRGLRYLLEGGGQEGYNPEIGQ